MAEAKRGRGRPSSFKPEFVEQAQKLARLGATDRETAEFFGVSESTLHLWKLTHPEFSESLKEGKDVADARVEQSLYRRALGYTHDAVKIFMPAGADAPVYAPYAEHHAPDTTAAIFWLKNRKPGEWRDVKASEHSGPGGGPIPVEQIERRIVKAHD
jgi:hypothetical protein